MRADNARNTVIDVPATPGRERAPKLVLQGHLDMVCERSPDSPGVTYSRIYFRASSAPT